MIAEVVAAIFMGCNRQRRIHVIKGHISFFYRVAGVEIVNDCHNAVYALPAFGGILVSDIQLGCVVQAFTFGNQMSRLHI